MNQVSYVQVPQQVAQQLSQQQIAQQVSQYSTDSGTVVTNTVAPGTVNPDEAAVKPHWTGGYGLTIAIIALVFVIFIIILFLVRPNSSTPVWNNANWTVYNRTTTNTTDIYTAYANSIYMNNSNVALTPLVIQNPGVNPGSLFIVDNTNGGADITCCFTGTGQTCTTGGIGATVVSSGTAQQFVWTSGTTVNRYWISSRAD